MAASILANERVLRLGRHRAITVVMLLSAAVALGPVCLWWSRRIVNYPS